MERYRCYRVYIPATRANCIAKTVQFYPASCLMPKTSFSNDAVLAARALANALLHPTPATPFNKLGNYQLCAIEYLASIFDQAIIRPPPAPLLAPPVLLVAVPPSPRVTFPPSAVPGPSPRVPAPPIVRPNLIEPDDSDEPDPGPSQPRRSSRNAKSQQCFASAKSIFVDATCYLLAAEARRHFDAHAVIDDITGQSLEYFHLSRGPNADVWLHSLANNLGHLAQGVGTRMPTGTNTVLFIRKFNFPSGHTVMYSRLVSSIRPHKTETHRVSVTVGGDKLYFPGITTTNCASLTTTKCLLNSVVSTPMPGS